MLSLLCLCLFHSPFYFRTDVTYFPHLEVLNILLAFTFTQNNGKFVPTLNYLVTHNRDVGGVEVQSHIFLTSLQCGGVSCTLKPLHLGERDTLRYWWETVDTGAGLDATKKREISCFCWETNRDF